MRRALLAGLVLAAVAACAAEPEARPTAEPDEAFSGGRATVFDVSRMAFAQVVPGVAPALEDEFFVGNAVFNRGWVAAPASVEKFDGLGPLFNATTCSGCHFKDGRGAPPASPDESFLGLLLRLSVPGDGGHGAPAGDPIYGGQIQGDSISGVPAEAHEVVTYEEQPGTFADGTPYALAKPTYRIEALANGPLADGVMVSPRVASAVFGLGLLEAVPEATILAHADPDDVDHDGISGRPNYVWDVRRAARALGRFGWKANQPTIEQQVAGAFAGDMGITSSLFGASDCTDAQTACIAAPSGGSPELEDGILASTVTYSHLLAVPARRHWEDATVLRGKGLFERTGCASCHLPKLVTGDDAAFPELARQTIRPYTDLLLHDMGPGLADGRPDFEASGTEWRTPPLWGIGLVKVVNRHTRFLHDGRARDLSEAILWHDGEARNAREAYRNLPRSDRDALVIFLESL